MKCHCFVSWICSVLRPRCINQWGRARTGETGIAKTQGRFFKWHKSFWTAVCPSGWLQHTEPAPCNKRHVSTSPQFLWAMTHSLVTLSFSCRKCINHSSLFCRLFTSCILQCPSCSASSKGIMINAELNEWYAPSSFDSVFSSMRLWQKIDSFQWRMSQYITITHPVADLERQRRKQGGCAWVPLYRVFAAFVSQLDCSKYRTSTLQDGRELMACTMIYDPVCATNGVTYASECTLCAHNLWVLVLLQGTHCGCDWTHLWVLSNMWGLCLKPRAAWVLTAYPCCHGWRLRWAFIKAHCPQRPRKGVHGLGKHYSIRCISSLWGHVLANAAQVMLS